MGRTPGVSPLFAPSCSATDGSITVLDARLYSTATWLGVMTLSATAVIMAVAGRWGGAVVFTTFAIACGIFAAADTCQPRLSKLLLVVAAGINASGWAWGVFPTVRGYDEFAHAFTSFTLAFILVFVACRRDDGYFRDRPVLLMVTAFSVVVALGGLWEVAQLAAGVVESRFNSIHDVGFDAIGAALAAPVAAWGVRRRCAVG